jgi:prepilin-type N-terminal cleavage/methylation domain-containing protein
MVLNNIKSKELNGGFTIVELLVVIVVIGILAAITIVSYTGITAKANLSKSQGNGDSIGQVIDTYAAENGVYPGTAALVTAGGSYAKIPAGVTIGITAPVTGTTATTYFQYFWCGASSTTANGAKLLYWDSVANAVTTTPIYLGAGSGACTVSL